MLLVCEEDSRELLGIGERRQIPQPRSAGEREHARVDARGLLSEGGGEERRANPSIQTRRSLSEEKAE